MGALYPDLSPEEEATLVRAADERDAARRVLAAAKALEAEAHSSLGLRLAPGFRHELEMLIGAVFDWTRGAREIAKREAP